MAENKAITVQEKSVDLSSPKQLVEFATTLKRFIVEQGLFINIQGKNYVVVEGWQFAGAATGIVPVMAKVERIENEMTMAGGEIKYRAEVKLVRVSNARVVGYGVAICSNKEKGRNQQDEYVIASMAQTRATGKAYRNAFAWLMKMAGYEPTPAEEVTGEMGNPDILDPETTQAIKTAKDADELSRIFNVLTPAQKKAGSPLLDARIAEIRANLPKKEETNATA